jgi:hypothetical protein
VNVIYLTPLIDPLPHIGGKTLLTNPQIITSGDLGRLFLEGNLPSTHMLFPSEHKCNIFCHFFQLPSFSDENPATFDSIASTPAQGRRGTKGKGVE